MDISIHTRGNGGIELVYEFPENGWGLNIRFKEISGTSEITLYLPSDQYMLLRRAIPRVEDFTMFRKAHDNLVDPDEIDAFVEALYIRETGGWPVAVNATEEEKD